MRLYHFTSTIHLPFILRDGYLKVTETNLDPVHPHAAPDAVWFLDGPDLGGSLHGLNVDSLPGPRPDKTQVRIEVEVPDGRVRAWLPWVEAQGIDPEWLDILTRNDGGREGAARWMLVFRKVTIDQFVTIEVRDEHGVWHNMTSIIDELEAAKVGG
jgi:hypothetical protein